MKKRESKQLRRDWHGAVSGYRCDYRKNGVQCERMHGHTGEHRYGLAGVGSVKKKADPVVEAARNLVRNAVQTESGWRVSETDLLELAANLECGARLSWGGSCTLRPNHRGAHGIDLL